MESSLFDALYVKRFCPSCIKEFYPGDCEIVSSVYPGKVLRGAARGGWKRHAARMNPEPLTGPEYTRELARRKCPHCGYLLPFNIERVQNVSIVVVGDNLSGKSCYIAALLRQLEDGQWMTREQYTRVSCLTPEVEREYYRFYEHSHLKHENKSLYEAISPPPATNHVIYELSSSLSSHHLPKSMNVILYEVPGDLELSPEDSEWRNRCFLHADAMIFLTASEKLANIDTALPTYSILQEQTGSFQFLQLTLQLLERLGRFKKGGRASHFPIAVTVSKSDLFRFVHSFDVAFLFSRDCAYSNETTWGDIEAIDRGVRELLIATGNSSLVRITREMPQVKFFAVSAGAYAAGDQEPYATEPCRCLDPVLWFFHELGVISEVMR